MRYEERDIRFSVRYHFTHGPLSPLGKDPWCPLHERRMDPRTGLDVVEERKSLSVTDAVNSGLASVETYCMYGPTAVDTSYLSF